MKNHFVIGREKCEEVSLCVSEPVISRRHALIEKLDGACYISDLESKNRTWYNKTPLNPGDKQKLANQSEISFGSIEFYFIS